VCGGKEIRKIADSNFGILREMKRSVDAIFKRISKAKALSTANYYSVLMRMDKMNVKHEIYLKEYERELVPMYIEHSKYLARLVKTASQITNKSINVFTKDVTSDTFDNTWCHEIAINQIFGLDPKFNADCNPLGL
jgi:GTPase Era involved in 16S rRNA processing